MDMVVVLLSILAGLTAAAVAQLAVFFLRPEGEDLYVALAFAAGMIASSQYFASILGV